ncbi:MAG: rhomboid family intramembrane serine protease [Hungatella sp.]
MSFLNKMERKFGRYAVHNLMYYIIMIYFAGIAIQLVSPMIYWKYLSLDAGAILHGQIWRIVTFIIYPPISGVAAIGQGSMSTLMSDLLFNAIALSLYYSLGTTLEQAWGSFRFNVYFLMGIVGHVLAALLGYLVFGQTWYLTTSYLNFSLFFAFAALYPNMQFLLFFVIPVKAKWLAVFNGLYFLYGFIFGTAATRCAIVLSLANFIIFFFMTQNYQKVNPKEIKRKREYKAQVKMMPQGKTHHKCAVCGRTEKDGENLEFRYCSKCEGDLEYCQDHLYTHRHVSGNSGAPDQNN